ncbi:hypothetical protein IMCC21224_11944 [Puniceibacterium sp. IMCC21224]|nr:hypothetical protein IMCC21224_11944 [Puniceibacterium sp. IMCC21224]
MWRPNQIFSPAVPLAEEFFLKILIKPPLKIPRKTFVKSFAPEIRRGRHDQT